MRGGTLDLLVEAIDAVAGGLAILDAEGRIIVANAAYRRIYPLVAPWSGDGDDEGIVELDGDERWIRVNDRRMKSGAVLRRLVDISDHKRREAEMMTSQVRLREALESLEEGLALFDCDDRLVMYNGRYRAMFTTVSDIIERGVEFATIIRTAAARGQNMEIDADKWIAERMAAHHAAEGVFEHRLRDGRSIMVRERKTADGHILGTYSDITAVKEAAERQHQSQKLEALGHLAGGVAHEFNNLLTAIGGFAKMALRHSKRPEYVRECIEEIIESSDRAANLTGQMLAFGRKEPLNAQIVRPADIVRGLDRMLRSLVPETIELVLDVGDEGAAVDADPSQLSQAVLNLAINARDAMPEGGRLVIGTGIVTAPARLAPAGNGFAGARCAAIFVRDTGTGMTSAVLSHIFEPFFTTKEQGKGTGLGLPVVHSIVERSGGVIDVETEPGRGTTFSILLPLAAGVPAASAARPRGKAQSIFIVIVEPNLRNLAYAALTQYGFQCARAADHDEAVAIVARMGSAPDLLLTDIAAPGTSRDIAAEFTAWFPALKVVRLSGDTARAPFSPEHLAATVRAALDGTEIKNPGPVFLEAS